MQDRESRRLPHCAEASGGITRFDHGLSSRKTTGLSLKFVLAALVGLLTLACSAAEPTKSMASSQAGSDFSMQSINKLTSARRLISDFQKFVGTKRWSEMISDASSNEICPQLLTDLRDGTELSVAVPTAAGAKAIGSLLPDIRQCPGIKSAIDQKGDADPAESFSGLADFGDRNLLYYSVPVKDVNALKSLTVNLLYGEFEEKKLLLNSYFDGYTAVDVASCTILGGVTIQRPISGDDVAGAPRQVLHGLFKRGLDTWVITATARVGRGSEPVPFLALDAWRLDQPGKFEHRCKWMPKNQ